MEFILYCNWNSVTRSPTVNQQFFILPLILITGLFAGILLENRVLRRIAPDVRVVEGDLNESIRPTGQE